MAKNKQQIKFEADISGFKSAIKESEKHISSLNKELKLNAEQLKGNSKNVDLLQKKLKELQTKYEEQSNVVENTSKALETAKETFGENSEEARKWKDKLTDAQTAQEKIKNAIEETNVQLKQQTNGWITHGKSLEQTGDKIEKLGDKLNSLGNKVSIVSAGVAATIIAVSKAAIDYESAFAGVVKTVDGTEEQLKAINDGILDMSTRMPAAATEIAGVAESAGQLGIKTDDILNFTEVMINLGESTNLSADEAASALAKFANITNMSADDYGKLGSVIVDLGNNFATTEADIVSMATRLAATGELTGLSQSQIMALAAAMSSVGIEAEAGGSAMSKLLKRIQVDVETGSDELKEFAKVAGVSTSEFKKAFQDDAVNALSMFLAGLQDTERNGKSAIAILDDLDIKEVRLSNTVLSLSNAHEVLSDAVKTANNAWDDNTALQNEVDKRYATTESQIKMLKNEATKMAIEFGRELTPSIRTLIKDAKPMLKGIADAIKGFSNLDSQTKKNIITISGLVVAAGPALKIIGTVTSGAGKVTTAIGKITSKIGEASSGTSNLSSKVSGVSAAFGVLGIAATAAAVTIAAVNASVAVEHAEYYALRNEIDETVASRNSLNETTQKAVETTVGECNRIDTLKEKLAEIVDSNGKVKDGYEKRAEYIVNELKDATGLEIDLTDGVIKKYDELGDKIDDIVKKKKIESIFSGIEGKYKDSSTNLDKYLDQLEEAKKKSSELREDYYKALNSWNPVEAMSSSAKLKDYQESLNKVKDMQAVVDEARDDIAKYNYAVDLMADGSEESMNKLYDTFVYGASDISNMTETQLNDTIDKISNSMQYYADKTDEASQKAYEEQKKMLANTAETLANITATTDELSPDVISAWQRLAGTSAETYAQALSTLPPDTISQIQIATGYVVSDEQLSQAFKDLGRDNIEGYNSNDFKEAGKQATKDIGEGANSVSLYGFGQTVATTYLSGFTSKMSAGISKVISMHPHADGLAYVPYNGYIARLHRGERVLTKQQNEEYMANQISNNNNNVNVSIYTQTLTQGELERVSRYIEKKWGGKS